ncbi:MAG: alpha/beta hydrolase [Pedobacter sp.]
MSIPHFEIHFSKDAERVDSNQVDGVIKALRETDYTDLIVLCHGWNNNIAEARNLYGGLLDLISSSITANHDESKRFAALNIFWPSKKFTDAKLIPGGAASNDDSEESLRLENEWKKMADLFDDENSLVAYEQILEGIQKGKNEEELSPQFQRILAALNGGVENSECFDNLSIDRVKTFLQDGSLPYLETGQEAGGAASNDNSQTNGENGYALGFFFGMKQGFANMINLTTYYKMKARAGEIGTEGLSPLLSDIKETKPNIDVHLVGHSFGARLVTSCLQGIKPIEVKTLALLQAAFSHYAFAKKYDDINDGFFRQVLTGSKVKGAILITHTRADRAVGLSYALASRLLEQESSDIGDKSSLYGGLGGNGAQKTPEVDNSISLRLAVDSNQFRAGKVYNLLSDNIIGGHSDVVKPEVADILTKAFLL